MAADFTWPWRAAQYLLAGENPYLLIQPTGGYPAQTYFYYPLTSAILAIPFAYLHPYIAGAVFFGLSSALLAFAISRDGWNQMPIFLSAPYWIALMVTQWSPLIVAATLLPWMQWLLVCKPNIGIAGFVYHPTWRGALGSLLFLGLCFLILPSWLKDWLHVSATLESHPPPVFILPFGPLLLFGFLRWRTATGRLFIAMSGAPVVVLL